MYNGGNSTRFESSSAGGMRTPLSSCRKYLVLPVGVRGDGDRCPKGSIAACGTSVCVPLRLVCDPARERRDKSSGELNVGDDDCGSPSGSGVKGGNPPPLDRLAESEG